MRVAHPTTLLIPTELAVGPAVALEVARDAGLVFAVELCFLVTFC